MTVGGSSRIVREEKVTRRDHCDRPDNRPVGDHVEVSVDVDIVKEEGVIRQTEVVDLDLNKDGVIILNIDIMFVLCLLVLVDHFVSQKCRVFLFFLRILSNIKLQKKIYYNC